MNSHIFVAMAGWTDYQESQQSLIWSVSRFTKVHQLRPFDAQWTEKHLKKLNAEIAQLSGKNILALTGGIPGLNEKLVSQQKVIFDEVGIVTYLVNQVIFPRFASRGLEEVRKELVAVAPFRQFDTRLFQHLLEQLWPKIYQDMSLGQARNTLRKLRRTSLMQQAQDTYGYVIPHDIRRVIENYLFLSQPELYIEINFLAILWFRQEISEGEYPMIVNEIYHLASVWRYLDVHGLTMIGENFSNLKDEFKSQINCIEHLNQRLVSVLEPLRINPRTPDWVEKIMRALKATEFRWLLKEEDIEKLLQVCKTYLREEFDDHDVR